MERCYFKEGRAILELFKIRGQASTSPLSVCVSLSLSINIYICVERPTEYKTLKDMKFS